MLDPILVLSQILRIILSLETFPKFNPYLNKPESCNSYCIYFDSSKYEHELVATIKNNGTVLGIFMCHGYMDT